MASKFFGSRRENRTLQNDGSIISELKFVAAALTGSGLQEPFPGWLYCNGAAISRATYEALFSAVGTAYGVGDGSTTFNLPDYRGRVITAQADGQAGATRATTATRGTVVGAETVALATGELPVHTHTLTGSPSLTGSPTLTGSPALSGAIARSGATTGSISGTPGISDPGHTHDYATTSLAGQGLDPSLGYKEGSFSNTNLTRSNWVLSHTTGITATAGTLGVSISDGITVNNGTLAVGVGTLASGVGSLAATIGTLASSNAGSGTAHNNLHPTQGAGGVIIKY